MDALQTPADQNLIYPVIIIGAGLSGLMAQAVFQSHHISSLIIEKSRGMGGRCATRRGSDFKADLGAQFFNSRILESKLLGLVKEQTVKKIQVNLESDRPRLIHTQGMSQIAKLITSNPLVVTNERVTSVSNSQNILTNVPRKSSYLVSCESGKFFTAKNLLFTPPVPQSLELLEKLSFTPEQDQTLSLLKTVQYDPSIALLLELNESISIGHDGIWKDCSDLMSGIYNQQEKGLDTVTPTLVAHSSPAFSRDLWNLEKSEIENEMLAEAKRLMALKKLNLNIKNSQIHKWKYSEPKTLYPEPFAFLGNPGNQCALAGDAFLRSSVGGALASGEAAALAMIKQGI